MEYNPITPQGESIIHLFVIWHTAMDKKDEIINDLNKNFQILKVFRGHWDRDKFLDNFLIFYAHSQKHRTYLDYRRILLKKIAMCKTGDFEVIVFQDNTPQFEKRKTSSGIRYVNIRAFDKKQEYRKMTGGGHRVHGSDDAWETNKDLTIMFGMNTKDFCNHYAPDISNLDESPKAWKEENFYHNCIGVGGYKNIQELFYVLNNTIDYVVLRNHEPIPDEYRVEGHGDIDLLVENRNYAVYLTGAVPVYPQPYRVYHHIKIGESIIPFDFRAIYDNYYDLMWQTDILRTRVLAKKLFYVPNAENQFYSLLYHAYIQKNEVKKDYLPKLASYGSAIGIEFKPDPKTSIDMLDKFMTQHNYEYIRPKDLTVVYNLQNLSLSTYGNRYGNCIKRNHMIDADIEFDTITYKKENSYIKRGSLWLIENEYQALQTLSSYSRFPKVLHFDKLSEKEGLIEISALQGIAPMDFFSKPSMYKKKYILGYIQGALELISILAYKGILHRDLFHDNFLIDVQGGEMQVSLIDFGWATTYEKKDAPISTFVCQRFAPQNDKYDLIEFANVLKKTWRLSPLCRNLSFSLKAIAVETSDPTTIASKVTTLSKTIGKSYNIVDSFVFTFYAIWNWRFLQRGFRNHTFQIIRNHKGVLGKVCNTLENVFVKFI